MHIYMSVWWGLNVDEHWTNWNNITIRMRTLYYIHYDMMLWRVENLEWIILPLYKRCWMPDITVYVYTTCVVDVSFWHIVLKCIAHSIMSTPWWLEVSWFPVFLVGERCWLAISQKLSLIISFHCQTSHICRKKKVPAGPGLTQFILNDWRNGEY